LNNFQQVIEGKGKENGKWKMENGEWKESQTKE
jgi:hypothetical protein